MERHCSNCKWNYNCIVYTSIKNITPQLEALKIYYGNVSSFIAIRCSMFEETVDNGEYLVPSRLVCPQCHEEKEKNLRIRKDTDSVECLECNYKYTISEFCPKCGEVGINLLKRVDNVIVQCLVCDYKKEK
jgi:hypothetical protein